MKSKFLAVFLIGVGAASFANAASPAAAAEHVNLRGAVVSVQGPSLTVRTRQGETSQVELLDGWKLTGVANASVDAIKPGNFVGISSVPTAAGGNGAVEVVVLPDGVKGNEGSFPWDLKPKSTMTNATVTNAVKNVDGNTLTVTYRGQDKEISIPIGTPVVTLAPAGPSDLVPGAIVFVPAERNADGSLSTRFVVVGTNGIVPPM